MDDVITNSSIDNSSNSKYSSVRGILKGFANETTAHGIPRIIDRPKTVSKIFWSILVVIAFYVFISQTHQLVKNYYSFNTKINLINSQSVHFPAVTVCNLNKLKASSLVSVYNFSLKVACFSPNNVINAIILILIL